MTEEQSIQDGERVERLLADPAVVSAFEKLEAQYITEWKNTTDPVKRESLHAKVTVLEDVRTGLRTVVDAGKVARTMAERRAPQTPQKRR